jgi:hypothetical protein
VSLHTHTNIFTSNEKKNGVLIKKKRGQKQGTGGQHDEYMIPDQGVNTFNEFVFGSWRTGAKIVMTDEGVNKGGREVNKGSLVKTRVPNGKQTKPNKMQGQSPTDASPACTP